MVCPYCLQTTKVTNSRRRKPGFSTWRRRYCQQCRLAFSTLEQPLIDSLIVVKGADGTLKPLRYSDTYVRVFKALGGLETASEAAVHLTKTCLDKALALKQPVIAASLLERICFETLKAYQATAGQRYLLEVLNQTEAEFLQSNDDLRN